MLESCAYNSLHRSSRVLATAGFCLLFCSVCVCVCVSTIIKQSARRHRDTARTLCSTLTRKKNGHKLSLCHEIQDMEFYRQRCLLAKRNCLLAFPPLFSMLSPLVWRGRTGEPEQKSNTHSCPSKERDYPLVQRVLSIPFLSLEPRGLGWNPSSATCWLCDLTVRSPLGTSVSSSGR